MRKPEKAPESSAKTEPPAKVEEPVEPQTPAESQKPAKADAPAKAEQVPVKEEIEPPTDRKSLEALVKKHGTDIAVQALSKVRVVDLRALAREYNGEFGIAGREIRNANKKVLIEEFRKYFSK